MSHSSLCHCVFSDVDMVKAIFLSHLTFHYAVLGLSTLQNPALFSIPPRAGVECGSVFRAPSTPFSGRRLCVWGGDSAYISSCSLHSILRQGSLQHLPGYGKAERTHLFGVKFLEPRCLSEPVLPLLELDPVGHEAAPLYVQL